MVYVTKMRLSFQVDLQFIGVTPAPISGFDYECEVRAGQQSEIGQSSDLRCKTSRVTGRFLAHLSRRLINELIV